MQVDASNALGIREKTAKSDLQLDYKIGFKWVPGGLLEACQVHEKVALEHSSKSTKYELEGSYGGPVHEHFSFLKTAKLPRERNEVICW